MLSPRERELSARYTTEILGKYNQNSVVPLLTHVQIEGNIDSPDFLKIGRRILIPHEYFEPNHVIIMHPFVDDIETSEFQYIINQLTESSQNNVEHAEVPDFNLINNRIESLGETIPSYIIIPIAFFVNLHQQIRANQPVISYEGSNAFYTGFSRALPLRILWSNKYVKLNEIIMGNFQDSAWRVKPFNNERLRVDFSDEGLRGVSLTLETVFKFNPPLPDRVAIVRFPENICKI